LDHNTNQNESSMRTLAIFCGWTLAIVAMLSTPAQGASLTFPNTTVLGGDVSSGPTFTVVESLAPTDVINLTVGGQVTLQGPSAYGTNAAGIVTLAGSTGVGGTSTTPGGFNFGALLLGNNQLGFVQLFAANAGNGLGSNNPSQMLSLVNVPIGNYFTNGIQAGSTLEWRVADIDFFNNSGAFRIQNDAVPEPSTWAMLGGGLLGIAVGLRRKKV
jgi:hypothetical protein